MNFPNRDEVTSIVSPIFERFGVPGVGVALVDGDKSVTLGYGVSELETGTPVDTQTTFQLASCSKAHTATTCAMLVDQGVFSWDDPVGKYLPEFRMPDDRLTELVTLRDLLSMRLGLAGLGTVNWGRNLELGVEKIFEGLPHLPAVAGFRELFTYLNPAYTLMAEIVTRVTGRPFTDVQHDLVYTPLGLTRTLVHEGTYVPESNHAFPHVELDEKVLPVGMAHCGGRLGESCVYSCADDAARWIRFHLQRGNVDGDSLVSPGVIGELYRPHVYAPPVRVLKNNFLSYGMGWQIRDTPNGPIYLHEGGEFGVSTFTMLDPDRNLGVAVYANLNSSAATKSACYTLLDRMAGREAGNWADLFERLAREESDGMNQYLINSLEPYTQEAHSEHEIEGSYYNPVSGMIDIVRDAEGLTFRIRDGWVYDCQLIQQDGNLYTGRPFFRGMEGLGRRNVLIRFHQENGKMCLHAAGFGAAEKLS
nr:serine hydrolase domain-containing protein [uncultured Hyphomonas sp.]